MENNQVLINVGELNGEELNKNGGNGNMTVWRKDEKGREVLKNGLVKEVFTDSKEGREWLLELKRDYLELQRDLDELYSLSGEDFEEYLDSEKGVALVGGKEVILRELISCKEETIQTSEGTWTIYDLEGLRDKIVEANYPKLVVIGGELFAKIENEERAKPNTYYAGITGRIFSLYTGGMLEPQYNKDGYYHIILQGERTKYYHHQAVINAFLGRTPYYIELIEGKLVTKNPEGRMMDVHHINRKRSDNSLENLEFLTQSENAKFRSKLGRDSARMIYVRYLISQEKGEEYNSREIAEEFGTTEYVVENIIKDRVYESYTRDLKAFALAGGIKSFNRVRVVYSKLIDIIERGNSLDDYLKEK